LAGRPTGQAAEDGDERLFEVGIELMQTMSEKAPTLLVRTHRLGDAPESAVPARASIE
jgi:hypothetical protein